MRTLLLALALTACSGSVEVTGIPDEIELKAPYCVPAPTAAPAKDAGADAKEGGK